MESCHGALYRIVRCELLQNDIHKNNFRKHNEPNTKDLPYIYCIMPSLPFSQSAKREYQSSIKLGYLQGLCPFKVVHSLVYCLAHIAYKISFITNLSSIFHTYDL